MATLKELLEGGDLGAGQSKTASANVSSNDMDGMDKLAMQLGLFGDTTKVAEAEEHEDEDEEKEDHAEKKASAFGSGLHGLLFPDSVIGDVEKTASEKEASTERAMGAAAYDQFSTAFDRFVEKLAGEALAGSPHGDSQAVNHLPNNKAGGHGAIDTAPEVDDEVSAKNDEKTVGHYEQTHVKAASAFRKHMLLSMIEG